MIPQLESRAAGAIKVPPPRFRPLGHVSHVNLQNRDYVRAQGMTLAQQAGLRYEAKVQEWMLTRFVNYLSGPVLSFLDDSVVRALKPDGLLIGPSHIVIFEIKHQHCPEAWWQLEKLYKVALDELYHRPISLVEICRSYDPAMPFPCEVELVSDLEEWTLKHQPVFGVYVWRKTT